MSSEAFTESQIDSGARASRGTNRSLLVE